ncbi:Major facilitator superfamily domain, general substrate transporter [Penicillium occitanis (nom. inval.)]|nr:Major facilitator superfamily domain, general substrate transporter [Penicillium occitanis (nom. inval.)]PCG93579.1 hypothetical protein PENOC_086960 [Penicillium occitanis (nom. inval.)]
MDDQIRPRESAPGTEILIDQGKQKYEEYQHVTRGNAQILLVPQPSLTDPNDPLRWPRWKKWLTFANGLFYAFNGAMTGPMMAGGSAPSPLAVKFGRRPVYLTSNLLMGIACVWLAIASEETYPVFVLARAFLGLWEAPIEAIVPSTVADIFFLHERGEKISIYGLSVLGGNEIGPLVSAYVIQSLSMRWAFFIVAICIGVNMITMFFLMPETKFTGYRPVLVAVENDPSIRDDLKPIGSEHRENVAIDLRDDIIEQERSRSPKKKTFVQDLAYYSTTESQLNLFKIFLRPFVLMVFPTVLWASALYGMSLSWNVILGSTVAQLFGVEPYYFSSGPQGLIFLSPFIGSLIGTYLCGPIADRVATYFTIRNDGIREPEMRLPTCIVAAALTMIGAVISGVTYHYKTHWSGPIVGFAVLSAGAQMGATLSMSYALDCHKELSAELMVTVSCLKSTVAWIWTWCINDWLDSNGTIVVFVTVACLNMVVYGIAFILHLRGKQMRIWIHKKNFLSGLEF